ncbi:hypothetical protein ACQKM2_39745 [Streptomyces sp. NPDC004126]|uniref:hypothetical protein n=1 Tax=Streptomyces sp. NPDC004126 TaxID=3390695 RepID=UPI003CFF18E8
MVTAADAALPPAPGLDGLRAAARLHGARDERAFGRHLRTGRAWARAALAESGLDEDALTAALGRPGLPLAKVLDEYLYVTLGHSPPPPAPAPAPR